MTRLILIFLNLPALVLLTAIGIAIQTSLFTAYPFVYLQPDMVLLVVIWCALQRSFFEGGVITLILGNIAELHSAAPQGFFLITYLAVYFLVRTLSRILVIPAPTSMIGLTMAISVVWHFTGLGVLNLMGSNQIPWRSALLRISAGALTEGVAAIWVYRWLERFDWVTYKNLRARQALEAELQLEGEMEAL